MNKRITLIACPAWANWAPHPALLLLAAQLRRAQFEVDILDLNIDLYNVANAEDKEWWKDFNSSRWEDRTLFDPLFSRYANFFQNIADQIVIRNPALIGFCINSGSTNCSIAFASLLKSRLPNTPLIAGGPDCFRAERFTGYLENTAFDAICPGEGDTAIVEIAAAVSQLGFIPNTQRGFIVRGENNVFIDNGDPDRPADLDALAPISLEGIQLAKYTLQNRVTMSISRGCTKRCTFCSEGMNFFRHRSHTPAWMLDQIESIIQEIRHQGSDAPHLNFNDSLINGDMEVLTQICDGILSRGLKFTWGGMAIIRPEMDLPFLQKMRRAGCIEICWGIESGSTTILAKMRKGIGVSLIDESLRLTRNAGIMQYGNIIVGFPGEHPKEFAESLFFVVKDRHYFQCLGLPIFMPTRNSTVYKMPHKFGMISLDTFRWETDDGGNTPQIRVFRRQLLSDILGTKKFEQGKYQKLEAQFRSEFLDPRLQQEFFDIANNFYKLARSYFSIFADAPNIPNDISSLEELARPDSQILKRIEFNLCLAELSEYSEKNHAKLPLLPDRFDFSQTSYKIQRSTLTILPSSEEAAHFHSGAGAGDGQWRTVGGGEHPVSAKRYLPTAKTELTMLFDAGNAFQGISELHQANLLRRDGVLIVQATSHDPALLLPELQKTAELATAEITAEIDSPCDAIFQVYYMTRDMPQYIEAHSVIQRLQKGKNTVNLQICEPDLVGPLRIDPGNQEGTYNISRLEVLLR